MSTKHSKLGAHRTTAAQRTAATPATVRTGRRLATVHLTNRNPSVDRLLRVTNTLAYLTETSAPSREKQLDTD